MKGLRLKKIIFCECSEESQVPKSHEFMYEPEEYLGMNHKPGRCKGTYKLTQYRRPDGDILWLCSCCVLSGDVAIKQLSEVSEKKVKK